jgi:hypothetical protein
MSPLIDPTLNLFVRGVDLQFVRNLPDAFDGLATPFDLLGTMQIVSPYDLGHRFAVPSDDNLAAFLHLVDQAGKMSLGLENPDVFH